MGGHLTLGGIPIPHRAHAQPQRGHLIGSLQPEGPVQRPDTESCFFLLPFHTQMDGVEPWLPTEYRCQMPQGLTPRYPVRQRERSGLCSELLQSVSVRELEQLGPEAGLPFLPSWGSWAEGAALLSSSSQITRLPPGHSMDPERTTPGEPVCKRSDSTQDSKCQTELFAAQSEGFTRSVSSLRGPVPG